MTPADITALRATARVLADNLPSQASVIGQALRLLRLAEKYMEEVQG